MVPYKPLFWRVIAPIARHAIAKRKDRDVAKRAYQRGKGFYRDLLLTAPSLGEGNPMLPTFCESMVFVALWLGADGGLTVDDLRLVTADVLGIAPLKIVGVVKNGNRGPHALDFQLEAMRENEAWAQEHEGEYEAAWRVSFDDERHEDGIFFEYTRCPIAEHCSSLGLGEVTPALCEIDYLMCDLIHAHLYREHTIAEGAPTCDYWMVGNDFWITGDRPR